MILLYLSTDIHANAKNYCDYHVRTKITEYTYVLSSVLAEEYNIHTGLKTSAYAVKDETYLWLCNNPDNQQYLVDLLYALHMRYYYLYGHTHRHHSVLLDYFFPYISGTGKNHTVPPLPEQAKAGKEVTKEDVVQAFRAMYPVEYGEIAKWEHGKKMPYWYPPYEEFFGTFF